MITMNNSNAYILGPMGSLDYFDQQSINLPRAVTPLDVWNLAIADPPSWLRVAFRIRDAISSLFGVQGAGGFSGARFDAVKAGDRMDFFLVEHVAQDVLVMTANDKHLDVMISISTHGKTVDVTASVKNHNTFGRAYMVPVGIAHRWIVRDTLKRLKARVSAT
ncbi:hypothetical protein ACMU_15240 [Actibacterium mucosum KCTC 23349]|uniref:DUF2867 domain-containing protein n=1 Tax=Actibacterium mucosum KCTC 23349 TaxID=1454373 RepID=A0A037ZG31_9RHOB|nr:DUF2867 domain-containing protein [Actibacterium mucosum]KAJ55108.1 hypothetical protein ACMU_15240 [Actibacterium mucosum KCTC 23349]